MILNRTILPHSGVPTWSGLSRLGKGFDAEPVSTFVPESRGGDHNIFGEGFWQRRYYDFNVCSRRKLREKLDYIHGNTVQERLVGSSGSV